jgi:hypothetical protein
MQRRRPEHVPKKRAARKNKSDYGRFPRRKMEKAATLVMLQPSALCERAYSVDTCTVAALDAITAFAVPNPNCSSQNQSVFSGLVARQVALLSRSLSLLRTGKFYFANPFSRRRQPN